MAKASKFQVTIPADVNHVPETHEVSAAQIVGRFLQANVHFVARSNYKSPDLKIGNELWEIKSPTGAGKRNIERQLQLAMKQSNCIILDARRSKIHMSKIRSRLAHQAGMTKSLKKLLLITKSGNVEVVK